MEASELPMRPPCLSRIGDKDNSLKVMNISKENFGVDQSTPTFVLVLILFFVAFQSEEKGHF